MLSAPPISGEPRPQQLVRLRSPAPFSVRTAADPAGAPTCQAFRVEGVVRHIAVDTIWFQSLNVLDRAPASSSCTRPGPAFIVTSEVHEGETTIRRFDLGRTVVIVVVGVPLAVVALFAIICGSSACYN